MVSGVRPRYPHLTLAPPPDMNRGGAQFASLYLHLVDYEVSSHSGNVVTLQWAGGSHDYSIPVDVTILELSEAPDAGDQLGDITVILPEWRTVGFPNPIGECF
jgi:hypothetical protein